MPDPDHWFEAVWGDREERIYPQLFGSVGDRIFPAAATVFTDLFKQSFDPRWLRCGVFQSPPNQSHDSWLYVSSGLSNDWDAERPDPDSCSGLGCEFVFETTSQANWAILRVQHILAFQLLLGHDRYPGRELLDYFHRIPLRASITPEASALTHMMVAPPSGYPDSFHLQSGSVDLLALVGITDAEAQFARDNSGEELLDCLREHNAYPVTDPTRRCTLSS